MTRVRTVPQASLVDEKKKLGRVSTYRDKESSYANKWANSSALVYVALGFRTKTSSGRLTL